MATELTAVSLSDLLRAWEENSMPVKRAAGLFIEIIAHTAPASNPLYSGGVSQIVKLLAVHGQHIGTVHAIVLPDGTIPHSHPKDYTP